ncbi:hypothetical protein GCM10009612_24020 [Streptomyces beijiangensis]
MDHPPGAWSGTSLHFPKDSRTSDLHCLATEVDEYCGTRFRFSRRETRSIGTQTEQPEQCAIWGTAYANRGRREYLTRVHSTHMPHPRSNPRAKFPVTQVSTSTGRPVRGARTERLVEHIARF